MDSDSEIVYCVCKQYYDPTQFMIECDVCKDWFHGSCVGVREDQSSDIEEYHCPSCSALHGPLILKKRTNFHRHDPREDYDPNSPVQSGTLVFINDLKTQVFHDLDDILLTPTGNELNEGYLERNGFKTPILVENKEGLGLLVPPPTFTVSDVEQYVGSLMEIDVIDVAKQDEIKMLMREWVEYYNSPNRDKALNVISLEFSNTNLSNLVQAPAIVRRISWVENMWPEYQPDNVVYAKPQVSKYCLMGVKNSYTDFHIDFGGTSVWYHVLRGEKVFYFVRPTSKNLKAYEEWSASPKQSDLFLGNMVDMCYKCVVKQGQTLFIPTGWIHAVLTSIDSLVFGGNFLHSYNSGLQIKIYEMEKRLKTPQRFQFPWFETLLWFAAKHLLLEIKEEKLEESSKSLGYLMDSARTMVETLKSWITRKELRHHLPEIPESINYSKLVRDLNKEVKAADKALELVKRDKRRGRNQRILEEITQEYEVFPAKPKTKKSTHHMPAQILSPTPKKSSYRAEAQIKLTSSDSDDTSRVRLRLSNGKIISSTGTPGSNTGKGGFQALEGENEIIVDDISEANKVKTAAELLAGASSGPLKLKLSFNGNKSYQESDSSPSRPGYNYSTTSSGFDSDEEPAPTVQSPTSASSYSSVDALLQASKLDGLPLPHISNADIEAELKQQPASPGTQAAIQGMLAIAQPQKMPYPNMDQENIPKEEGEEGGRSRRVRKRKRLDDYYNEDDEEMRTCFTDDKYVYPSLDEDESDEPVSRPKPHRRDTPWNPRAKVVMPVPKMNRPHREGVMKPHLEEGLADVKVRLANRPEPKREYIRKKPQPKRPSIEDMPSTSSLAQSLGPYDFKSQFSPTLTQGAPAAVLDAMRAEAAAKNARKPRKGMATAKQRLSKILKLGKKRK